jgi:hypothetical protein
MHPSSILEKESKLQLIFYHTCTSNKKNPLKCNLVFCRRHCKTQQKYGNSGRKEQKVLLTAPGILVLFGYEDISDCAEQEGTVTQHLGYGWSTEMVNIRSESVGNHKSYSTSWATPIRRAIPLHNWRLMSNSDLNFEISVGKFLLDYQFENVHISLQNR